MYQFKVQDMSHLDLDRIIAETGAIERVKWFYTLAEEDLITAWRDDGFPLEWEA